MVKRCVLPLYLERGVVIKSINRRVREVPQHSDALCLRAVLPILAESRGAKRTFWGLDEHVFGRKIEHGL